MGCVESGDATTVSACLAEGRRRLADMPSAALESELLLTEVLGVDRAWLFANPGHALEPAQRDRYEVLLLRRECGEPIAYVLGRKEFWSLTLVITPDVLIPRPETELLVQAALDRIPDTAGWRVADLGTGSGAVALAIARERPNCEVHASDISAAALMIAARNAQALGESGIHLHLGSWLEPLEGRFHAIVSNPPYVAEGDPHLEQGDCRFEPRTALTAGRDGMEAIARIGRGALPRLLPGGFLAFEHGFEQGDAVRRLLGGLGYTGVETLNDLEGRERVTLGLRPA